MSENGFENVATNVMQAAEIEETVESRKPETVKPRAKAGKPKHIQMVESRKVRQDKSRDALLTDFGKKTLVDRYLLPGESYQDMFARVAEAYGDNQEHAQRIYDYMSQLWFMPATPVLSNGGAARGLPISCFLNSVDDSLGSIVDIWNENVWLASNGGGIGTCLLYTSPSPRDS